MEIEMDVSLDPTLGCGQAHRWVKKGGSWEGVLGGSVVTLTQTPRGFRCEGDVSRRAIVGYFRPEDDLAEIYADMSAADPLVAELAAGCPGLRILRQEPWECIATYLLATNANVKRIASMVDAVCREFGRDLGGRYSFPSPEEIAAGADRVCRCGLGYRAPRLAKLARMFADGGFDAEGLADMGYAECVSALKEIDGVGDKVADCVALFAYGHLEAFPVDARIGRVLRERYGRTGGYAKLSAFARDRFGRYPGYAQEILYHCCTMRPTSQAQAGGLQPVWTS